MKMILEFWVAEEELQKLRDKHDLENHSSKVFKDCTTLQNWEKMSGFTDVRA